jgi:hypothetical protein
MKAILEIEYCCDGCRISVTEEGPLYCNDDADGRDFASHALGEKVAAAMKKLFRDDDEFEAALNGFLEYMELVGELTTYETAAQAFGEGG